MVVRVAGKNCDPVNTCHSVAIRDCLCRKNALYKYLILYFYFTLRYAISRSKRYNRYFDISEHHYSAACTPVCSALSVSQRRITQSHRVSCRACVRRVGLRSYMASWLSALSAYSWKFSGNSVVSRDRRNPIRFRSSLSDVFGFIGGYYLIRRWPDTADTVYMATRWVTCNTYIHACRPIGRALGLLCVIVRWAYVASAAYHSESHVLFGKMTCFVSCVT